MERRRFLGALTAASLGAVVESPFSGFVRTQNVTQPGTNSQTSRMSESPQNTNIILVHAAWADGSCWSNIVLPLKQHGMRVMCAPIPLTSLTDDTAALARAVERTSGTVVLVGHAYSGAVIAAVKEDRVRSLVYIAALAPDEGETVAKVFYRDQPSPEQPKMVPDSHGLVWMPDDAFRQALAHKASAEQQAIAAAVQRPIAVPCIQQPAPAPGWKTKPSWYLVAEEDRMINPKTQHFMAERMRAKVRSGPVDHTPMYSNPDLVVQVIEEAARDSSSRSAISVGRATHGAAVL